MGDTKDNVGRALEKLKPAIRDVASAVGEAGQAKVRGYASRAVVASREIAAETGDLSGNERKKQMKALVLQRIGGPFPVRWGLSPLVRRVVDIAVDIADVRSYVVASSSSPESRNEASAIILKRLNAPFYLRWTAKRVVGYALDVAAECSNLLNVSGLSGKSEEGGQAEGACVEMESGSSEGCRAAMPTGSGLSDPGESDMVNGECGK